MKFFVKEEDATKWASTIFQGVGEVMVLVDPGAAGIRAQNDAIDLVRKMLPAQHSARVRVMVLAGPTLAKASQAEAKLQEHFPKAMLVDTKLSSVPHGSRAAARKGQDVGRSMRAAGVTEFCITAVLDEDQAESCRIPWLVADMPRRCKVSDCAKLICSGNCYFLSQKGMTGEEAQEAQDDEKETGFQYMLDNLSEEDGEDGAAAEPTAHRVFSFARPVAAYSQLLRTVGVGSGATALVIVQATCSPNAAVAGTDIGINRIGVACKKVSEHQYWHGKDVLWNHFFKKACKNLGLDSKRSRPTLLDHLQFMRVHAKEDTKQIAEIFDLVINDDDVLCGIDNFYISQTAVEAVQMKDLYEYQLQLGQSTVSDDLKGVFARRPLVRTQWFALLLHCISHRRRKSMPS